MRYPARLFVSGLISLCLFNVAHAAPPSAARADTLAAETLSAISSGNLHALKSELDQQSDAALSDLKTLKIPQTAQLSAYRELARFFAPLNPLSPVQQETLRWLVVQPNLMPTLMSAISNKDQPASVLDLLNRLRQVRPNLDEYAELATAIVVVWDKPLVKDATYHLPVFDDPRGPRLFTYFTNPLVSTRFPLRALPWELSVYVVDLRITEPEITWAVDRYRNRADVSSSYFDVAYDESNYFNGAKKRIDAYDYTLPNILQYGGVCVEQAHFSSQIAKSLGIPACLCSSEGGGSGQCPHAWIGFLETVNNRVSWNFEEGRYKEDLFWSADIADPQTHEKLTDADVGLLADLQKISAANRIASALILKLSDRVAPTDRMLFLMKVVDLCPANRRAWLSMATLGKVAPVTPAQADTICVAVKRLLANPYPDFACQILLNLASSQPPDVQIAALDKITGYFPTRPDLRARIRLRQAVVLHGLAKDDQAMQRLGDVLTNELNAGPIILQALNQVDLLLPGDENLARLIRIYSEVWPKMPKPDRSSFAYETPYYLVGKHFQELLEKAGNRPGADEVRNALEKVYPTSFAQP